MKIARLAIDDRHAGKKLGLALVEFALGIAKTNICPMVGCRFAIVDSKEKSVGFYEKCGFTLLDTADNRALEHPFMYLDLHPKPSPDVDGAALPAVAEPACSSVPA
ncbi:GNAT family N-acetyltransferase [Mesorhizobium sp. M7A.F.Ca.MR.362.00.0.0]|uniref:GNAT family N-acetyltransferase n=1 Tax=Mesorhizobium sp. M7A.F.Ca.MR.362.00.0.0 TaxID=2496779 RepID=UPI0034D333CF